MVLEFIILLEWGLDGIIVEWDWSGKKFFVMLYKLKLFKFVCYVCGWVGG